MLVNVQLFLGSRECQAGETNHSSRKDCHPEPNATEEACQARGCCWNDAIVAPNWCYYPNDTTDSRGKPLLSTLMV